MINAPTIPKTESPRITPKRADTAMVMIPRISLAVPNAPVNVLSVSVSIVFISSMVPETLEKPDLKSATPSLNS